MWAYLWHHKGENVVHRQLSQRACQTGKCRKLIQVKVNPTFDWNSLGQSDNTIWLKIGLCQKKNNLSATLTLDLLPVTTMLNCQFASCLLEAKFDITTYVWSKLVTNAS